MKKFFIVCVVMIFVLATACAPRSSSEGEKECAKAKTEHCEKKCSKDSEKECCGEKEKCCKAEEVEVEEIDEVED